MANAAHVAKFAEGPVAWNAWRADPSCVPDLAKAVLTGMPAGAAEGASAAYDLGDLDLNGVEFRGDLSAASFFKARLTGVTFRASLEGADFRRSSLTSVDLVDRGLSGCKFGSARLQSCCLDGAGFARAEGRDGAAPEAGFENAVARGCSFRGVDFAGVRLQRGQFVNCDLREARGLVFDENVLRGTLLSPYADDGWSVLRRTYTGANMVFLLLPARTWSSCCSPRRSSCCPGSSRPPTGAA
jgi:uncharacterized protein YjbI with pentapeptide repeats